MKDLTYICAFYFNQGMLIEQQNVWRAYPRELRQRFHTIVTDDLSPEKPAREVFASSDLASQRLYLALEHRRWDWLFCRNLGVQEATTDWVLLTDIDHVLPETTLRALFSEQPLSGELELQLSPKGATRRVTMPLDPDFIFRFSRVDAHHPFPWAPGSLTPYKDHPNSWLMTRAMFQQMGGYDERFSGYYGSDSDFRERCKMIPENGSTRPAKGVVKLDLPLVRYPREVIPDASTTTYKRKAKEDGHHVPRIKAERALEQGWYPKRIQIRNSAGKWTPMPWQLEASC